MSTIRQRDQQHLEQQIAYLRSTITALESELQTERTATPRQQPTASHNDGERKPASEETPLAIAAG